MARLADALQVVDVVSAAEILGYYVINFCCRCKPIVSLTWPT